MTALVFLLTAVLVAIALAHILWGMGWWFPLGDEAALTRAVVGSPRRVTMPGPVACGSAAVMILGAASVLWWAPGVLRDIAITVCGAVFIARGAAAYVPSFRRLAPEEPFASLDRRLYGPLCLALGAGFWTVVAG